jgi:hypothetical protein
MALTLTKETGAGLAAANAYADVADGDAYHEGHLYATAWTGATSGNKAAALVMASRVIDAECQFLGTLAVDGQALQWPRTDCPDADGGEDAVLDSAAVPAAVVRATCELARELLAADRTGDAPGVGLVQSSVSGITMIYDTKRPKPVLPRLVLAMVNKYLAAQTGQVRVTRV